MTRETPRHPIPWLNTVESTMAFNVEKTTYIFSSVLSMLMIASLTEEAVGPETREQESLMAERRRG